MRKFNSGKYFINVLGLSYAARTLEIATQYHNNYCSPNNAEIEIHDQHPQDQDLHKIQRLRQPAAKATKKCDKRKRLSFKFSKKEYINENNSLKAQIRHKKINYELLDQFGRYKSAKLHKMS